ncbi:hypothetical protein K438DRAFT_1507341, partial [Mycena galopus ATCC 62051]
AQSTMYCEDCKTDVKPGFAGPYNFEQHRINGACERIQAEAKKKKPVFASLGNFFTKRSTAAPLVPSTVSAHSPVHGATFDMLPVPQGTGPQPLHEFTVRYPEPPSAPCLQAEALMRELRAKLGNIPVHAPLADLRHPLAIF